MNEGQGDSPIKSFLEDEYTFDWPEHNVRLIVERIREDKGALRADFTPKQLNGSGTLPSQALDLISAESAKRYANVLGSRLLDGDTWFGIVAKAQELTREHYRSGDPSVVLADVDWRRVHRFAIQPYVEQGGITVLFGDGGVSKSMHALALGLSASLGRGILPGSVAHVHGPVVYLDWEADAETHAERLQALCRPLEIDPPRDIRYMRRTGSLHESIRDIRREIANTKSVLAIVDSIGAACGGDPESAQSIIRAFDAMRALAIPVVAIHHVPKEAKDPTKPFGSVYAVNLARLTWRLTKEAEYGGQMYVKATNHKGNNVGQQSSTGHTVSFEADDQFRLTSVEFTHDDSWLPEAEAAKESGTQPPRPKSTKEKIEELLGKHPEGLTVKLISAGIDVPDASVRTELNRNTLTFWSSRGAFPIWKLRTYVEDAEQNGWGGGNDDR